MFLAPFLRGLARHLHLTCLALTAATAAVFAQTTTPTAADGFDPNVDGNVFAILTQGDGKMIVVGQFGNVQPNGGASYVRNNIARLNPDGSLDTAFDPNANGAIRAVGIDSQRRILIGGDFTQVGGVARNYIARLNPDGTVDPTFNPAVSGAVTKDGIKLAAEVLSLAVQPDDHVVVGGTFGFATASGSTTAVTRNNIVRFDDKGAIDAFDPNANAAVLAIALHTKDGALLIGGGFTTVGTTSRNHLARLNANGTVDPNFSADADNAVAAMAVQNDGSIVVGGYFTTLAGQNRGHIGRLSVSGSLDTNFTPSVGGSVLSVGIARDGGVVIGGHFNQIYTADNLSWTRTSAAKLTGSGYVDGSFNPSVNGDVDAIAFQADGKVVIGGYFTRAQPAGLSSPVVRNHIARVLPDGALETAFQVDAGGRILTEVTQKDGKIIVGGSFTNIGGSNRYFLARLNTDGTLDASYNPTLNGPVYAMAYDSTNDRVVIGGAFTTVGAGASPTTRNHIARIDNQGNVDSGFDPNLDGPVGSIVILPDSSILVGGTFLNATPNGATTATARSHLLKLTSAGQLDTNFNPSPDGNVSGIAVQSDGKIIVVGSFTTLDPGASGSHVTYRTAIARLNTDGTVDSGYNPNPNPSTTISAVVIQSDGKAVIGGNFAAFFPDGATAAILRRGLARVNTDGTIDSAFDPEPNGNVLALALQPSDGSILVGGTFTLFYSPSHDHWTQDRYIGRIKSAGTVDTSFNPDLEEIPGSRVDSISIQSSGAILFGGTFTAVAPTTGVPRVPRNHFARVTSAGALDLAFNPGAGGAPTATINAISMQTDGTILVGGQFTDLGGATSTNIAKFTQEGTTDRSFNAALATDGPVNTIGVRANGAYASTQIAGFAWLNSNGSLNTSFKPNFQAQGHVDAALVQPDGSVLLAGSFADVTPQGHTGGNFVRLDTSGNADYNFSHVINGEVYGMVRQSDGSIILYGNFTSIDPTPRNYIARLKADGTLDNTFDPNPNSYVTSVVVQNDGSIVLAGNFTSLAPNENATATTRNYIARVTKDGAIDANYNPNLSSTVNAMVLQSSDGKVVVGGNFTTAQPGTATSSTARNYIARFNTDGSLDTGFDPNANSAVNALGVLSDGTIVVGGAFTTIGGATHNHVAEIKPDNSVNTGFTAGTNDTVGQIAVGSGDAIVIGGFFTTVTSTGSTTPIARFHVARLTKDGSLDQTFNPDLAGDIKGINIGPNGSVLVGGTFTSQQPLGLILVGGAFSTVGGVSQANLAELNADGSVNANFQPNPDKAVNAVLPLADGRFVVAGAFANIAGTARNGIARFNADGSLDSSFTNPAISGGVSAVAPQSNGSLIVGTGTGLVRLNTDGTVDTTFNAAAPFLGAVAIAVQPDDKIVVAGAGSGVPSRVMRLNADGSVDSTFTTASVAGNTIQTLTVQTDGSIIVAGSFTSIGGQAISNLARLTSTGAVDTSYAPAVNGAVTALALQSDGRLMIGGAFNTVTGLQRYGLARLTNTGAVVQALAVSSDGKTITWVRRGTAGQLAAVTFEKSADAITWVPANQVSANDGTNGAGTRVGTTSDWQITNATIPTNGPVYIRARGIVPTSAGKSTGVYELVQLVNIASQVASTALTVAPVQSTSAWDATHYVWTIDAAGVMRIADAYTLATLDPSSTVLINGGHPVAASGARLADLSTRGVVTGSSPLIGGFTVMGSSARTVLIRAVGPGLAPFAVTDYLKTPELVVYNSAEAAIATVKGWNSSLSSTFTSTGAFPLTPGSSDAATILTLQPGTYTVHVLDADGASSPGGEALVEVYDAGSLSDTSGHLANLSARATVAANGTLIGGLYVSGNAAKTMLIRGVGPALARYGVGGVLADPTIAVYDANGDVVVSNDNWQVSNEAGVSSTDYGAAMSSAASSIGAFPLDNGSADAALVVTLPAGAYTVQVKGVNGTIGSAMLEVYELP